MQGFSYVPVQIFYSDEFSTTVEKIGGSHRWLLEASECNPSYKKVSSKTYNVLWRRFTGIHNIQPALALRLLYGAYVANDGSITRIQYHWLRYDIKDSMTLIQQKKVDWAQFT